MKNAKELQVEQYGKPINMYEYHQTVQDTLADANFWLYYNIDYKKCNTVELLRLLNEIRRYQHQNQEKKYEVKFQKIMNALKQELANREHIPNKKEKEIIRKSKFKR